MRYHIRNRYIVEIDAQIEANDMQDALEQAHTATLGDLVIPRDGVTIGQEIRVSTETKQTNPA